MGRKPRFQPTASELELAARILLGAIGEVGWFTKAEQGDANKPGLAGLRLPKLSSLAKRKASLRNVFCEQLRLGYVPSAFEEIGDAEMGKRSTVEWEWRFRFHGIDLFVKTELDVSDVDYPILYIKDIGLKQ
ncbi:MAG: hypothetical protein ACKVS9_20035 [Phycisphaerae bacterium]